MTTRLADSLDLLDQKRALTEADRAQMAEFALGAEFARLAFQAREAAGLTRTQLGRRVGVKAGIIEALEENDFAGDGARLFARVMYALGLVVEVRAHSAAAESRRPSRRKSA
ncbi:MAG: helix-turn-helix domain-containing protein [bacterium]